MEIRKSLDKYCFIIKMNKSILFTLKCFKVPEIPERLKREKHFEKICYVYNYYKHLFNKEKII